jgi:hypothetical protein
MIATATDLANDSKRIIDDVVHRMETAEIQRHGKTVALIRPKVGVSGKELWRRLQYLKFSEADRKELEKAIKEGGKVFGNVGSH